MFFSLLTLFFSLLIILPHESIYMFIRCFIGGILAVLPKVGREFGKKKKERKRDGHIEGIVYRMRGQTFCTLWC